jgi:HSP20 family molecular chaperone IbpA
VGFLKRLLGSTDAVEDARERAGEGEQAPAGWNVTSPEVEQTQDEIVFRLAAPGLDADSFQPSLQEGALVLRAHGTSETGAKVFLDERFEVHGADMSQATVKYEDGKVVVRLPRSALSGQSSL